MSAALLERLEQVIDTSGVAPRLELLLTFATITDPATNTIARGWQGKSNAEIAAELIIGETTVKTEPAALAA